MATMTQTTFNPMVPADLPVRLAARVIDTLVLVGIGLTLGKQIGFKYDWLVLTASIVLGYFVLADALFGKTLGKAALRLRVTGADGNTPTIKQALIRECFTLFGAIPFAGPFLALASWIWVAVTIRSSPLRQGIHDRLAGTRVTGR